MKIHALTAPLLIAALIFIGVWAMGMLAVKSSALATESSLELLRLHIEVTRLHDTLQTHSQRSPHVHLEEMSSQLKAWKAQLDASGFSTPGLDTGAPHTFDPGESHAEIAPSYFDR